jgi:hypothetical protein
MSNAIFDDAIVQLKAMFATIEAEAGRQGELAAQITAVKNNLRVLEQTEREARQRLDTANADVMTAQRKYTEATKQAEQILATAREQARSIREQALHQAEEDAARITEAALDEARQSVRKKRGLSA